MTAQQQGLLETATAALQAIPEIVAIVLGGSHARGLAHATSDLDIGIYYREDAPLPIDAIRAVAASVCTAGTTPVVTDLYGWGPWVNGGAWIQTPVVKVDFIYRNLDQVRRVIDEGHQGVWRHDYDQQPPHGFRSVIYFGETHWCVPLHDPHGEIAALKPMVERYPPALRETIVRDGLWGAEFSLWSCESFLATGDHYNAAACLTRAAQYVVHALFAMNEEYFLNDKHTGRLLSAFARHPENCMERLTAAVAHTDDSLNIMRRLWADAVQLTNGAYQPRFDMTAAQ